MRAGVKRNAFAPFAFAALAACIASGSALAGDWQLYGVANGGYRVSTHPTAGGQAFITTGMEDQKTFFTQDGGVHWVGNPASILIYDRPWQAGTTTWVAYNRWLHRSPDQGRSWMRSWCRGIQTLRSPA
jgi:hypothetical protein